MKGLKKLERTGKILHESELTILVTWLSSIQVYFWPGRELPTLGNATNLGRNSAPGMIWMLVFHLVL